MKIDTHELIENGNENYLEDVKLLIDKAASFKVNLMKAQHHIFIA